MNLAGIPTEEFKSQLEDTHEKYAKLLYIKESNMSIYWCDVCWKKKDNDKENMYTTEKNDSVTIYCETCWEDLDPWYD